MPVYLNHKDDVKLLPCMCKAQDKNGTKTNEFCLAQVKTENNIKL